MSDAPPGPTWEERRVALDQRISESFPPLPNDSPMNRAANTATTAAGRAVSEMAGVGARYIDSVASLGDPPKTSDGRGWSEMRPGEKLAAGLRRTQQAVGAVMGAMGVLQDMVDVGFANLTNPIAKMLPAFPAATLSKLYVGLPHAHSHPPSLIPPAPPVPLPSLGPILLGTCVRVLIGGLPAARSGDLGIAPTCCGFQPFFQIKTGSSNVFIGGARAARSLDVCVVCGKGEERQTAKGVEIVAKPGKEVSKFAAGMVALGMAADLAEAAEEPDPAMQAAKAMSAAMAAAQLAADIAAAALTKSMGTDPCIPPVMGPPSIGAVTVGVPNVLIGGFPMPNLPDPAGPILNKLKSMIAKLRSKLGKGAGACA